MSESLSPRERIRFLKESSSIKDEPDFKKLPALFWREILIEFEKFLKYKSHKGKLVPECKSFCEQKNIAYSTLQRKRAIYKKEGIKGLMPDYGKKE